MLEKNAQYSQRECVEAVRIPSLIADEQLGNTVCKVLHDIGANITNEKIESCHQLNKNTGRTSVKYVRRKDFDQIVRVKTELKKLKSTDMDLREGTKLCINESLRPYYTTRCKKV